MDDQSIYERLAAPFPQEDVNWRIQGKPFERNGEHFAMALAFIDARDVMDRLDEVVGPANWQDGYEETPTGRVICKLAIRNGEDWNVKADGAGATAVEGEKGGLSDAFKRAAVKWGIGRYLYRMDAPWVKCTLNNKGFFKKWAEDPWSKVKVVPYHKAEAATQPKEPDPPAFNAKAAATRIKGAVDKAESADRLTEIWNGESKTLAAIKAADPSEYQSIRDAMAKRGEQFKEAA